jgi:hypothetical protein
MTAAFLRVAGLGALVTLAFVVSERGDRRVDSGDAQPNPALREVTIHAGECAFVPNVVAAARGDRMRITLIADDRPHSFVIDEYRIARRFAPGSPSTVELLLDRAGRFVFYSNLTSDACDAMRGELLVSP